MIDADPFVVAGSTTAATGAVVASDGTDFLVAWSEGYLEDAGWPLMAARVGADGTVLDPQGILVTAPVSTSTNAVTWDGLNYVVAWSGGNGTKVARISADGGLLDSDGLSVCDGLYPAIASDGESTWVAAQNGDLYGTELHPDSTVTWTGLLAGYPGVLGNTGVAVAPGGALLGVANAGAIDIFVTDGTDAPPHSVPSLIGAWVNSETIPSVGTGETSALVVWADNRGPTGPLLVYGQLTSVDGPPAGPAFLVSPLLDFDALSVASDGPDFMVVSEVVDGSTNQLYWERVLADGGVPDFPGVSLEAGALGNVVFGLGRYVIFWQGPGFVRAASFVDTDGGTPVQNSFAGATDALTAPVGALEGSTFLFVWEDRNGSVVGDRLYVDGGVESDAGFVICNGAAPMGWWADGGIADAGPAPCFGAANYLRPQVASNGAESLVVWNVAPVSGPAQAWAALVPAGSVPDANAAFQVAPSNTTQLVPEVAFDGTNFVVTWLQGPSGGLQAVATRVSPSGVVLDPLGIVISTADAGLGTASVAAIGNGRSILTYSSLEAAWNVPRVIGQFVNEATCRSAADCPTARVCSTETCAGYSNTCETMISPDGTKCDAGSCIAGVCVPTPASSTSASSGSGAAQSSSGAAQSSSLTAMSVSSSGGSLATATGRSGSAVSTTSSTTEASSSGVVGQTSGSATTGGVSASGGVSTVTATTTSGSAGITASPSTGAGLASNSQATASSTRGATSGLASRGTSSGGGCGAPGEPSPSRFGVWGLTVVLLIRRRR